MAVNKDEVVNIINKLTESDQKSVLDFALYLTQREQNELTQFYANLPEVDEPCSEEELRQLNSDEGFITGEEAKREFNLKVDLP